MDNFHENIFQFRMFGAFEILIGDEVIKDAEWRSKKALLLLKYLLTKNDTKVAKEVLLDLFWPEENSNLHNLHVAIHNIRKVLKEKFEEKDCNYIYYSKGYYWFDPGKNSSIDCIYFEELYKEGVKTQRTDSEKALDIYQKAIDLYKDDFLADDIYEDWAMEIRQHYKDIFVEMIIKAAEITVELYNNHDEAIYLCRKALKYEPYQQKFYEILISSLLKTGKSVEATQIYQNYRKLMKEELGIEFTDEFHYLFEDANLLSEEELSVLNQNVSSVGPFLCSRNFFELLCLLEIRRYNRYKERFSLIILNINNSLYDEVKQYIIHICFKRLREGDIICQWDKKTIIIKLYKVDKKESMAIKQRLLEDISDKITSSLDTKILSVGDITGLEDIYRFVN